MKSRNSSNVFNNIFKTDFKAEVIAAEMINNGLPEDLVFIKLLGSFKRPFRKDVDSITTVISEYDHNEYTVISTYKEGIYDMLPEGLFHPLIIDKRNASQKEILQFINQHRIDEANARRFFSPFETAINHLRIQMALYESNLDKGLHNNELVDVFIDHWDIFKYLDPVQAYTFIQIIPLIYDIRDDYNFIETIFTLIFSLPVKISVQKQMPVKFIAPFVCTLNNSSLGVDFITNATEYYSGEDEIIITVGPINNIQFKEFMPGGMNRKILELLCDYLLPVHIEYAIELELDEICKTTRLTDKENDDNSFLGESTYL